MIKLLKGKKTILAWVIALILVCGTISFAIIYSRSKPIDKYEFLNKSILNMIKNGDYSTDKFDPSVFTKIQNHFSIYDIKNLKIKESKVLYQITSGSTGHVGYIIQFLKGEDLISNVLNFTFDSAGKINNVFFVA